MSQQSEVDAKNPRSRAAMILSSAMSAVLRVLSTLDCYIGRHSAVVLWSGLVIFLSRVLVLSRLKMLWRDEILTWAEAQSPSLSALWSGITHTPTTVDPPLHPIMAFLALRLPGPLDLRLRLPSVIGFAAMMLSLFVIMRRRAPPSVALIAALGPMLWPVSDYAIEARPYALLLGLCGWALALWQRAAENRFGRTSSLVLLFLCLTCALWTHYLALLLFVPLCAGEVWRTTNDGFDRGVWFAILAPLAGVLVYIPLLHAASAYRSFTAWQYLWAHHFLDVYAYAFEPTLFVLFFLCCLAGLAVRADAGPAVFSNDDRGIEFRDYECVAVGTLFLFPVLVFGVAKLVTHVYLPRYALPFTVAAALLTSAAFAILVRRVKGLVSLALVFILLKSAVPLRALVHGLPGIDHLAQGSLVKVLDQRAELPIAVLDPEDYGRFRLFGPSRIEKRMVLVSVSPGELPSDMDPSVSDTLYTLALSDTALHRFISAPVEDFGQFIDSHSRFLLLQALGREEVLSKNRRLYWLAESDGRDVYLVERTDHP